MAPNPIQMMMDACDALGVQSAWAFMFVGIVFGPVFLAVNAVQDPSILTSFQRSQRAAFASMWKWMATPIDERYARYKEPFLAEVSGVVLDLGSGQGQNLRYLSPKKIKHLYLVEPNPGMHTNLRLNALKAGFAEDQFTIIATGAENAAEVQRLTGLGKESVDTVTSLLALCGIPQPRWVASHRPLVCQELAHGARGFAYIYRTVIAALYEYLKPGGRFYFFEHVASKHTPARRTQGGCWRGVRRDPFNTLEANHRLRRPHQSRMEFPVWWMPSQSVNGQVDSGQFRVVRQERFVQRHLECRKPGERADIATARFTEMSIDFETAAALDPKAYGWAQKPKSRQCA